jgi:predicted methyltransferase
MRPCNPAQPQPANGGHCIRRATQAIALSCATLTILVLSQSAIADAIPDYISAAVAYPTRPEADRQRDADRKPAEVIAFAGLKPGDKVADFLPAAGYFTRIFCDVVGDAGRVYAISVPHDRPTGVLPVRKEDAKRDAKGKAPAAVEEPASEPLGATCTNVTANVLQSRNFPAPEFHSDSDDPGWVYDYYQSRLPVESFVAPEPLDMIWISGSYHALHNKDFGSPNLVHVGTALLSALKPGGILMIEDHAAKAGSGARHTAALHRVDPEQVRKEAIAAGFEFIGESDALRRADDPQTTNAHAMHDKADRFLLKFRKP